MSPVFVHSMFRSGSTYIFNVFRRSPGNYWCYQEPLHENLLKAASRPEMLLEQHRDLVERLRHPSLDKPYWWELNEIGLEWTPLLHKSFIFDDSFGLDGEACDALASYLEVLFALARGRPVVEECRTFARVTGLRERMGGMHLYLWRNPWDQWWSYKVDRYFDTSNLLIINSRHLPELFFRVREALGFEEFRAESIDLEFTHFRNRPLQAADSYYLYFSLWCFALLENETAADLLVSIDGLSASRDYRETTLNVLSEHGVTDLDLDDCHVYQTGFSRKDAYFFAPIEERVFTLFRESGYSSQSLDHLTELRSSVAPAKQYWTGSDDGSAAGLIRDAQRARAIVLSGENELHTLYNRAVQGELHLSQLRGRLVTQGDALAEARQDLVRAKDGVSQSLSRIHDLVRERDHQRTEADEQAKEIARARVEIDQCHADAAYLGEELARAQDGLAQSLSRIQELVGERDRARVEIDQCHADAAYLGEELARAHDGLAQSLSRIQELANERDDERKANDRLRSDNSIARQEIDRWEARAASLERMLFDVHESTSWRLTKPMRLLKGWMQKRAR